MRSIVTVVLTTFALLSGGLASSPILAAQAAKMAVTVVATGTDSTRNQGEWSKGSFSYRAEFTTTVYADGEPGSINMYDPEYAQKAMAKAQRDMEKIQKAMQGVYSDEEEPAEDNRYLLYIGQMDCPATVSITVNEKVEGEYADVGGMQPYTQTFTAQSTGTKDELNMICAATSAVLDIKDQVVYRQSLSFPEVRGHYVWSEANRGERMNEPDSQHAALPQIVSNYVFETLQVAPAKGSKKATLTPTEPVLARVGPNNEYRGTIEVEIQWDFAPL